MGDRALQRQARTIEHILPDVLTVVAPRDVAARQVQAQELAPERGRQERRVGRAVGVEIGADADPVTRRREDAAIGGDLAPA